MKKMDGEKRSVVIRCTEANAAQVQSLVKNDPELLDLVKSLQAQNLFPGLRAVSFVVTGDENTRAKGLGAWTPKNAPEAAGDAK